MRNEGASPWHSFIVKVWSEKVDIEGRTIRWRGYITHVPSGHRTYVKDVGEISSCIETYLKEFGASISTESRRANWIKKLRQWF